MRLIRFMNEAKAMAATKADWYKTPEMMGHRWAIEMVDKIGEVVSKFGRTPKQKAVIKIISPIDSTDWHAFANQFTKKDLSRLQYVLRRIDKEGNKLELLRHDKGGMIKDRLVWLLEYLAWKEDPKEFGKYYASPLVSFGMAPEDALRKSGEYITRLYNNNLKKFFQEEGIKL